MRLPGFPRPEWFAALALIAGAGAVAGATPAISWSRLPPLPDAEGFAGMYAGVSGDVLVAAGGTQFSGGVPWWKGGKKIWSDAIYLLDPAASAWRVSTEKLPQLLADGVSVSHQQRFICVGGGDESRAYAEVFALSVIRGRVERQALPPLPQPTLKMGGAVVGDTLYVIGGRSGPNAVPASRAAWALDLARPTRNPRWIALPDFPGAGRMMPVVAATNDALFVFGGIEIRADDAGRAVNGAPYLRDAWRFRVGASGAAGRWERLADLPQPLAGSPSPAWLANSDTILICGGVDGAIEAISDRSSIKSLPGGILSYQISADRWTRAGEMPADEIRVNAATATWRNGHAIISGEFLPARRTNACTLLTVSKAP